MIYILIYLFSVMVSSVSQVLLKKGAMKHYTHFLGDYLNPYVIIGYGLLFCSMMITIYAYKGVSLKTGPVLEATSYLFVTVLSAIFLKEGVSRRKKLGLAIVIVGVLVSNMPI